MASRHPAASRHGRFRWVILQLDVFNSACLRISDAGSFSAAEENIKNRQYFSVLIIVRTGVARRIR
jgi:tryptophanase